MPQTALAMTARSEPIDRSQPANRFEVPMGRDVGIDVQSRRLMLSVADRGPHRGTNELPNRRDRRSAICAASCEARRRLSMCSLCNTDA